MKLKSKFFLIFFCLIPVFISAQVSLVKDGKPVSRILVNETDETDKQAALLLQDFVKRISGAELPIMDVSVTFKRGDVLIGNFQMPVAGVNLADIKEDGFCISTKDGYLRIIKGAGKGSIYGVVTILEDYFGVRYYAADACTFTSDKNMTVPLISKRLENPTFRYRQTQAYSTKDPLYKIWHRLEEPNEVFAADLWVHTFDWLLPSKIYGKTHPEYYALINGERRPGWASQWCLTNPDVFEIVSNRVDSIFKANPDKHIISISQNDGHDTYCTCENCTVINEREESLSGSIIWFVNKLAEKFPDKEFSTLAYMYSVAPPKHIKPLPNVNIMLCNIECSREVILQENIAGKKFVKDMEGWSKISDNIFVWDYGIDFDSYLSPFPNFHVLKPNMELFRKNKTTMHFSQIAGSKGGDFSELRPYVVSKLMWNTSLDSDSLTREFLRGYYGEKAAPYLYDYIKLREGALMGSNIPLGLYDTPVSHKVGMLNPAMLKRYIELFDKAEEASMNNKLYYDRVKECRLIIQYSELEIAHTYPITDPAGLEKKLNFFRERANEAGVSILDEQGKLVNDYCDLYKMRYLSPNPGNLALNAKIEYITKPDSPYNYEIDKTLTDGILGAAAPGKEWIGWQNKDGEFIIDLGSVKEVSRVDFDFLQRLGSWALLPKSATWYASTDKVNFEQMGKKIIPEDRDRKTKFVSVSLPVKQKVKARYVKIKIESIGLCPSWHMAVGHPAWFLLDEVFIY
ncbi:DUF4838 domain-containing protein [Dysgonomonas sp. OttesenSCG-928-M03]|nr:DUF4838 domain-containing protein [Dysgonomonas sp. OttesenSCG-928-M03]